MGEVQAAGDWAAGRIKMPIAQKKILDCHALAKELDRKEDIAACHAIGQAPDRGIILPDERVEVFKLDPLHIYFFKRRS